MVSYSEDFRFLHKSILDNELVVFVGAGVSMGSGLPSWNQLVEEIKEKLGIVGSPYADNTIVPQLYYNTRGKKDYNELIHDLLDKPSATPNEIHECLVKMNPRYIITTNYDDLIEKKFNENGIFFDVIEKDTDLPYAHTDHMLIKMHGGFKYNNFVLKEDDYLNYYSNFTLISSYIKALFARYTILFVGYSYNDPDTKQLFSWVRNILREDQQRAYLINILDDFDAQISDYYKNMGINVIYAKYYLKGKDKYDENDQTKNTVSILNDIITPQFNTLSEIDNVFRKYDAFNYISADYIKSVFSRFFICYVHDDSLILHSENEARYNDIVQYFDSKSENYNIVRSKYPYINTILSKSSIKSVSISKGIKSLRNTKNNNYEITNHKQQSNTAHFEEFDIISIKNSIHLEISDVEENYLQKAYCYFYLKDFTSCYQLLRKAAKYYLSTKQSEKYIITENNRIIVGKKLRDNPLLGISSTERDTIRQELSTIEQYSLYANNYHNEDRNSPISELIDFKYIYKSLYRIIEKGKKVDEESRTYYSFYTGIHAYEEIEYMAHELYNYMQYNYLLLDVYGETKCIYTVFIDNILLSLSTKEKSNDVGIYGSQNIVLDRLSRFDLVIIFRFLSYKEIKSLTEKYKIEKIDLDENAITYIFNVISNLNNLIPYNDYSIYEKLFHIIKMLELNQEQLTQIYETVDLLLKNHNYSSVYIEIGSFIYKQYNERNSHFKPEELESLIRTICNEISFLKGKGNYNSEYKTILNGLVTILHNIAPEKTVAFNEQEKCQIIMSMPDDELFAVFSVSNTSFKNIICDHVLETLSQNRNVYTYYNALLNDVIKPIQEYEDLLFAEASEMYTTNCDYIVYCANLVLGDKFLDRNKFIELIKQDKTLSIVIDPDNYDYNHFEPKFLLDLTHTALKILSENSTAFGNIHLIMKNYILDNWDEKLVRIYIEFFS